jgi:hypothetical protein
MILGGMAVFGAVFGGKSYNKNGRYLEKHQKIS